MKTILSLNDEIAASRLQLANVAPDPSATQPHNGKLGCNCDRWGHPCAGCCERSSEAVTEQPISETIKK